MSIKQNETTRNPLQSDRIWTYLNEEAKKSDLRMLCSIPKLSQRENEKDIVHQVFQDLI